MHQTIGGDRPALGDRLQQAALGGSHDDRGHRARVQIRAEAPGPRALHQNLLEREPDLLALPGQGQAKLLVVPGPGPAGQEEPGEVGVALAVGGQEQADGQLEARARRIAGPRDPRQRGDDG
jgi:hypothetical protein